MLQNDSGSSGLEASHLLPMSSKNLSSPQINATDSGLDGHGGFCVTFLALLRLFSSTLCVVNSQCAADVQDVLIRLLS